MDPEDASFKKKKNRKRKKHSKKLCADKEQQRSEHQHVKTENATSQQPVLATNTEMPETSPKTEFSKPKKQEFQKQERKRKFNQDPKEVISEEEGARPRYSFQVDDTDHCETPIQAYRDIQVILDRLVKSLNKTRSTLKIYDPYYCDGGVKEKLASYGFTSVINQNRDFYDDIDQKATPEYDVLVTNPPYSGVHLEKVLDFCSKSANLQKPFLLLLPHFVYTKDYYKRALSSTVSTSMFFLIPEIRYSYIPPSWVEAKMGSKALENGKTKTSPFPSFWYCQTPEEMIPQQWLMQTFGPSGMIRPKHHSKLRYAKQTQDIPRDFRGEFDPSKKRPNPKARKRAAKLRREAASHSSRGAS
eukprot:scaffold746_cov293-Chaetoceros_neogracile.AAC.15